MRYRPHASRGNALVIVLVLFALFFAVVLYVRPAHPAASAGPREGWYADAAGYDAALAAQASSKQPVLVYFHTSWCGWCKRLEDDVFQTSDFRGRYPSLLKVRVDAEDGDANRQLTSDFGVRAYPTVFVIRPDGRRQSLDGYLPPADYFVRLDSAIR